MDFARSRPDTGIGDRGSGAALLSVPAGTAVRRGPPRQPPATPGTARATAATGLHGVSRVLFFLGEAAGACSRCCRAAAPAPVCWRIERERGKRQPGRPPQPSHAGSRPRTAQKDGEVRHRNFPRPPGSAGRSRRTRRRKHRAPRHWTPRPPPPRLPGATEGNHL